MKNVKKEAVDYQSEYSSIHFRLKELKAQADSDPKSAIPLLQKLLQELKKIESREQKINDNIRYQTQQLQVNVNQSIAGTGRKEIQYMELEHKVEQQENVIFKKLDRKIESLQKILNEKNEKIVTLIDSPVPQKILTDNAGHYESLIPSLKKVLSEDIFLAYEKRTAAILSTYREFREMSLEKNNQVQVKRYAELKERLNSWQEKMEMENALLEELTDDLQIQNLRCNKKWSQLQEYKKKAECKVEAKKENLTVKFEHNQETLKKEIEPLIDVLGTLDELESLVNVEQRRLRKLKKDLEEFQFYYQTYWQNYLKDAKSGSGKVENRKQVNYWKEKSEKIDKEFAKFIQKTMPDQKVPNQN